MDNKNACADIQIFDINRVVSTAESLVNSWDLRTDSIVEQVNPVQGAISRLCMDKSQTRLFVVTPGETFVKVLDANTLRNLYPIKMASEVGCFDVSHDLNRFAVGYASGRITVKSRNLQDEEEGEDLAKDIEDKDIELLE